MVGRTLRVMADPHAERAAYINCALGVAIRAAPR